MFEILINVITDVGIECDDEAAIFLLNIFASKNANIKLNILTVGGEMSSAERKERIFELMGPLPENVFVGCIDNYEDVNLCTKGEYNQKIILQIGPHDDMDVANIILENMINYDYFLLGDMGSTLNSKGKYREFADFLCKNSMNHKIIQTKFKGKTVIPCFTLEMSSMFNSKIQDEIIKLGFKNTFGRAPPINFTAHLVGQNGANYSSMKNLYETITSKDFDECGVSNESHQCALQYFSTVNSNEVGKDFRIRQFELLNQNESIQTMGLARIIEGLHQLFNFPKKVYLSSDVLFKDIETNFNESWTIYRQTLEENPKMPLTPCYDLISAIAVITYINGVYNKYFDENGIFKLYDDYEIFMQLYTNI